jgi:DNA gyrase subunit A
VVCALSDEIYAVASDGVVIRTRVEEIRASGRDTMGVRLMNIGEDRSLVAIARAAEAAQIDDDADIDAGVDGAVEDIPADGGSPG